MQVSYDDQSFALGDVKIDVASAVASLPSQEMQYDLNITTDNTAFDTVLLHNTTRYIY
jgi:hypothetical protein